MRALAVRALEVVSALTLALCGSQDSLGQTVYGYSSIAVTQSGVASTSSTDLDDVAQAYYTVETDAFLWVGSVATSGTSTTSGGAVTLTQPVAANTYYWVQTNHWVVPVVTGNAPNFACGSAGWSDGSLSLSSCGSTASPTATYVGTSYASGDSSVLAPAISGVDQTTYGNGEVGTTGYVIVYGTDLTAPSGSTTVAVGDGITATLAYVSQTQLNIYYSIPATAATGSQTMTISTFFGSASFPFTVNPLPTPTISSVSPNPAPPGNSVTITGTGFGPAQGSSTVTIGGQAATVTGWGATSIAALVPTGAVTGSIIVTVGGIASAGFSFQVSAPPAPVISGRSPTSGAVGTQVTITGSNFGAAPGTVTFGGTTASVVTWGASSIQVLVPSVDTSGSVSVAVTSGAQSSNGITFTVTPYISTLSLTKGPAQMGVMITGTSFGATQGASTVTLNGTAMTVGSWNTTQIIAQVPQTASTGTIVVTVSGNPSNSSPTFTVTQPFGCAQ